MLFDSHTHFNNDDLHPEDVKNLFHEVDNAVKSGKMSGAVDIGFDPASSKLAMEHAQEWPWCYATVGCHPHETKDMDEEKLSYIKCLAGKDKVVAIGEIGLDFHFDLSDRDIQRKWFRKQIRLANELKMPITIHAREADQEVMDILSQEGAFSEERKNWFPKKRSVEGFCEEDARVLLHCFSGSAELGKEYVKLGATISVAGPVTYRNNKKTVAMVQAIPIEYLLIETDAPYLTPEPFRGKRNTPLYVEHTARRIAMLKGLSYEEVAEQTKENALVFYEIIS